MHLIPIKNISKWPLLLPLGLFVLTILSSSKVHGQAATTIIVQDTRNWDSLPGFYKKIARFDFKYRTVVNSPGTGTYVGLMTLAPWSDASGGPVYQLSFAQDGLFIRTGTYPSIWNSWNRLLTENYAGITTLGNGSAGSGLNVNGTIKTKEVNVTTTGWPDYVFRSGYQLTPLDSLAIQVKALKHLPGMPSAREIETEGQNLGEINKKLLQKLEELTLYILQQQAQNKQLQDKTDKQGFLLEKLEQEVDTLKEQVKTK